MSNPFDLEIQKHSFLHRSILTNWPKHSTIIQQYGLKRPELYSSEYHKLSMESKRKSENLNGLEFKVRMEKPLLKRWYKWHRIWGNSLSDPAIRKVNTRKTKYPKSTVTRNTILTFLNASTKAVRLKLWCSWLVLLIFKHPRIMVVKICSDFF